MNTIQKNNFIKEYISFPFEFVLNSANFNVNEKNNLLSHRARFGINSKDQNNILIFEERDLLDFTLEKESFSDKKVCIIICCKDHPNILDFCLKNLIENKATLTADILVVDDRSADRSIYDLCVKYDVSYLRANNASNIFSFSNLNNIAAAYCYKYGKEDIIFLNNDVWADSPETFLSLLGKHRHYGADLSGTRLVYPKAETYQRVFGKYEHVLDNFINNAFDTIQHGGISYIPTHQFVGSQNIVYRPMHLWRFYDKNTRLACVDTPSFGVTGACQIINTELFINIGGFATSMCASYQDIDLCLRLLDNNLKIHYIGSEFLYHAETITSKAENSIANANIISDSLVFDLLWADKIRLLIGLQSPKVSRV